ncbi:hypothetical protein KHA93_12970 [Bacillus sp. FJAT-49732]|uniref:Uncharacterized protein n=1 Tax=Lederbergia citrisecunda TaxID=2833583 RepID=A0A942TNF8_9BACI|nr:hypothetical protein [Lederbergia citrisecunda]MBS4200543.1 hypothetical protein [Lederbergia citrisecunda]
METFLEIIRGIVRGIVCESSVFIFRKTVNDKKKTTQHLQAIGWFS